VGFDFVQMTNASEADKAIAATNSTDLGGRTLTIKEAKPKSERPGVTAGVLAAEVAVCAMTVAAIHGSRVNHAGNFSNAQIAFGQAAHACRR
jgi:RNA recognition motif-containing protein